MKTQVIRYMFWHLWSNSKKKCLQDFFLPLASKHLQIDFFISFRFPHIFIFAKDIEALMLFYWKKRYIANRRENPSNVISFLRKIVSINFREEKFARMIYGGNIRLEWREMKNNR